MRFIGLVLALCVCTQTRADLVTFEIDEQQSSVLVLVNATNSQGEFGVDFAISRLGGGLSTIFTSSENHYQITGLNFSLIDDLNLFIDFSEPTNMRSIADNIRLDLTSFSVAEDLGDGGFIQFGNTLRKRGEFEFSDDSLWVFDTLVSQDFVYTITREGDLLKFQSDLYIDWDFVHGDIQGNIQYQGSFVGYAQAVPEPSSLTLLLPLLMGVYGVLLGRSRR